MEFMQEDCDYNVSEIRSVLASMGFTQNDIGKSLSVLSGGEIMKLLIINGPNLNMLGIREPAIYGKNTYSELCRMIEKACEGIEFEIYQSNHEGAIVDKIQSAFNVFDGIVINPAAYTHTSVAILDAIKAVSIPTVEVHISKVDEREAFRQTSYIGMACVKTITGMGLNGYVEAINYLYEKNHK